MTTSLIPTLSLDDEVVPQSTLWFFQRHLQNAVYEYLMKTFRRLEDVDLITKAKLAHRIRKDPAQITRWFGDPGNMRLNTLSDLMVGMAVDPTTLLVDQLSGDEPLDSRMPESPTPEATQRAPNRQGAPQKDEELRLVRRGAIVARPQFGQSLKERQSTQRAVSW